MHLCITQWVKVNYSIPTLCILEWNNRVIMGVYRPWDQSKCVPIQWEISLQCNDNSHWLGAHLDWSLPRYIHLIQYNMTWAKSDHTHFVYIIHVMIVMTGKCFPHYWHFVRGIYWLLVDFPHKEPVMQSFDISFGVSPNKLLNENWRERYMEKSWHYLNVIVMI